MQLHSTATEAPPTPVLRATAATESPCNGPSLALCANPYCNSNFELNPIVAIVMTICILSIGTLCSPVQHGTCSSVSTLSPDQPQLLPGMGHPVPVS